MDQQEFKTKMKTSGLIISVVILLFFSIFSTIYIISNAKESHERYDLLDTQLELNYWASKSELIDSVQAYINKIAPTSDLSAIVLVNECADANVSIAFALAQGQKESHFGTKGLGGKTNSVFNVGAYDGHSEKDINNNYKYRHPNLSVKPYLMLLTNRYLVNKTEDDLLISFVDVNKKRYASYPKYEAELKLITENINNTTSINSLERKFLNLKNKRDY